MHPSAFKISKKNSSLNKIFDAAQHIHKGKRAIQPKILIDINTRNSLAEYYNGWPLSSQPFYKSSHTISLTLCIPHLSSLLSVSFHTLTSYIFIHKYEFIPLHNFLHTNPNLKYKLDLSFLDSTKSRLWNS